MRKGSVSRG